MCSPMTSTADTDAVAAAFFVGTCVSFNFLLSSKFEEQGLSVQC